MKSKSVSLFIMLFMGVVLLIPGCATAPTDYSHVIDRIEDRTGFRSGLKDEPEKTVIPPNVSLQDGVTLEEAITVALWNNAAFQEAFSGLDVSEAELIQANMLQNPQFWGLFPTGPSPPGGPLEFAIRFPLEALWLRPQKVAAAQRKLEQTVEGLIQNGLTLVRDVKVAFANSLLTEQRLVLTLKHAEILRHIAQINDSRWQAGEISELDAGTSRINVLQAEEQIHQLTHEVTLVQEQFRALIGLGFEDASIVLQHSTTLPTTQRSAEELLADALATRPDLRATELELEAAGQRVGLARKEIFVLTGIYRAQQTTVDPFNSRPGIQFTIPIFNQNQGGIAMAEAGVEMAARRYVTVRDQIALEVRQAHTRWLQTVSSVRNWRQQMLPAHRTATLQAQKAFEAGDTTPLLPLTAQQSWIQAQIREIELIAAQRQATAELERAIGHSLLSQPHRSRDIRLDPS
ncbi:MAG: TolC family protein [Nitrospirales bacterium]|nr:TolC family protein [Nitrospirales bacterium]